ncbi:protein phosphatase 2C domain-containing protein [Ectobacillus sp. JY-23]|uniref:protein phosphatase 2C domain-containing protein n=1 Tax=Ectobacillus sp. JY-23 TaxID=2933872 RepID=UPI001FF29C8D|nr:protein phosphatase 2C domain-containing protein [Ectobacillus sp. JY-23]UOY92222.1 protein phosphatase 2C domain-containing protein [Ectobacillus sp. JY-23]
MTSWNWSGKNGLYLDTILQKQIGAVYVGVCGGCTESGAYKNEDAAFVLEGADWELACVMDAHASAESVEVLLDLLRAHEAQFNEILSQPVSLAFSHIQTEVVSLLSSPAFRSICKQTTGETALLLAVRKDQFVWWLSIGDCVLYILHPDLARLGQYAMNQRQFFEWVGHVNTFELDIPCYTTGVRELREGRNTIVLLTDGLLEFGSRPFENGKALYDLFTKPVPGAVQAALEQFLQEKGTDSATIVAWSYENATQGQLPSSL